MTTKHSSRRPTALARRLRITMIALVLSALAFGAGASPSQADVGSVFFDDDGNAAAGDNLFNATFNGSQNVGLGREVLTSLTFGNANTATGDAALGSNQSGDFNVATGALALGSNDTGAGNVATGTQALQSSKGNNNIATGYRALLDNTTGNANVATGQDALVNNTTGSRNVAIGTQAGQNLTTGSNNVDIANAGQAGESGTIRIGNPNKQTAAFIAGITGTTLGAVAQPVVVKSNGQLGTAPAASASATSLATTVERLSAQLTRQQRQIDRLRERVRGG
jgi:hypothetical protein